MPLVMLPLAVAMGTLLVWLPRPLNYHASTFSALSPAHGAALSDGPVHLDHVGPAVELHIG